MITLARGNILEADAEALVNTVNCVGVMGKGIALQFKQAYPDNFDQYARACRQKEVRPGRMLVVPTGRLVNPRYIINFPTKRHWKGKSRIEDIKDGLPALTEEVRQRGIRSIAVPPLGCGNGGLDWEVVRALIVQAFADVPGVNVTLYEPQGAPQPEAMPVATSRPRLTKARALLVKLIERYGIEGYRLALLEVQKLAYFLQAAGERLQLDFVKHRYGPYADNLHHVLQRLEGHYIRGYGDRTGGEGIFLLPGASEAATQTLGDDREAQERLERVSRLIEGFENPYGMELLATVHWVAMTDSEAAKDAEKAVALVQQWSDRKRLRFQRDHVRLAWEHLHGEGWLPPGRDRARRWVPDGGLDITAAG